MSAKSKNPESPFRKALREVTSRMTMAHILVVESDDERYPAGSTVAVTPEDLNCVLGRVRQRLPKGVIVTMNVREPEVTSGSNSAAVLMRGK